MSKYCDICRLVKIQDSYSQQPPANTEAGSLVPPYQPGIFNTFKSCYDEPLLLFSILIWFTETIFYLVFPKCIWPWSVQTGARF